MAALRVATLLFAFVSLPAFADTHPCALPFTEMKDPRTGKPFVLDDAVNHSGKVTDRFNYANRYLVADLDTRGADGQCKGVVESYPRIDPSRPDLEAFPDLADSATLQ